MKIWLLSGLALIVLLLGFSGVVRAQDCCPDSPGVTLNCAQNNCSYGICQTQCTTQKNGVNLLIPYYDDLQNVNFDLADPTVAGIAQAVTRSLKFFFAIVGLLFLVYMLYGGFSIASSVGNPRQIESGKKIITRAIIGLLVMFMAFWMVQLLETVLGIEVLTSDGVDEPIPGIPTPIPDGYSPPPQPVVAINEPPPRAVNWGWETTFLTTLPYNGTEYAGARICYQEAGGRADDYRKKPLLAYGKGVETDSAVLGVQLAQADVMPPGWSLIAAPESTCVDILFDETFEPPSGAIDPIYVDANLQLSWEQTLQANTDYQWQVGAWVVSETGELEYSDYSPVSPFSTGSEAETPPTPTPTPEKEVLRIYPLTQFDTVDNRTKASIQGQELSFVRHLTKHPAKSTEFYSTRARFAAEGPVEIVFTSLPFQNPELRGIGKNYPVKRVGNQITIELPAPGHYYMVGSNSEEKVYLWFDDIDTIQKPDGNLVVDVTDAGVSSSPLNAQTSKIQQLIDNCPSGCTLYFPPGEYRSGHLNIHRNDITIYMDGGATLKGTDNPYDFITEDFGHNFINVRGHNITFDGPGTIDANGVKTYDEYGGELKVHTMDVDGGSDLQLYNTLFMDSNSWNIHLYETNRVTIRNIKIFSAKDGLDVDSTANVNVDTIFVESIDDNIPMKTRSKHGIETANVTVKNCMVKARKSSLKIGTENRATIRNITYDTCEIIDGQRALNIAPNKPDGGSIDVHDITFKNIRIYMSRKLDGKSGYAILGRGGDTRVKNVRYENIVTQQVLDNTFEYDAEIDNMRVYLHDPWANKPPIFRQKGSGHVLLKDVSIFSLGRKDLWGPTSKGDVTKINVVINDSVSGVPAFELDI